MKLHCFIDLYRRRDSRTAVAVKDRLRAALNNFGGKHVQLGKVLQMGRWTAFGNPSDGLLFNRAIGVLAYPPPGQKLSIRDALKN